MQSVVRVLSIRFAALPFALCAFACSTSSSSSPTPSADAAPDATLDARADGPSDAAAGSWCTGAEHFFCDDFDTVDAFKPTWGGVDTVFGSVGFDDTTSTSPPRSLVARLSALELTPGTYATGMLNLGLPTDTTGMSIQMQIAFDDLESLDAGPDAATGDAGPANQDVLLVDLGQGNELALHLSAAGGSTLTGALTAKTTSFPFTVAPALGAAFHPLKIDLTLDHATVMLDGKVVVDAALTGQPAPPRTASISVGTTSRTPFVAATVHVDDVTVDVTR
jgi:hypothetical protein